MLPLRTGATLPELQRYVAEMEAERGFAQSTVLEQALKLGEEVGELFKAIRKQADLPIDHRSITGTVAEELVDIAIYVLAIANRQGIDLEEAFREKEALNEERTWRLAGESGAKMTCATCRTRDGIQRRGTDGESQLR